MTNIEKYNQIFMDTLMVKEDQLGELKYQDTPEWDSIGHMSLIAELEDNLDIEMETDDIIDFSSYEKGKAILAKYNVEF